MDPNLFSDLPKVLAILATITALVAFGLGAWIF